MEWARISKASVAATLLVFLSSCTAPSGKPVKSTADWKTESLAAWKDRRVGKTPAFAYMPERIGYLVAGKALIFMIPKKDGMEMNIWSKSPFDVGSAAAVSEDGYYLTAAHCVKQAPLQLLGYDGRKILHASGVRVIWKSGSDRSDLALVHASVRPRGYFTMAGPSEIGGRGKPVLAGGLGGLKQNLSAGRIRKVFSYEENGVKYLEILHDTPLEKGDSGGPLMDESGRLLGVSSKGGAWSLEVFGKYWFNSRRSISVWVDPHWILSLIEEDRRKHGGR